MEHQDLLYPIWRIKAKWAQDGKHDPKWPKWHEGLPEGRVWNSTSFSKIFRTEVTEDDVRDYANDWWADYLEAHDQVKKPRLKDLHVSDVVLTVEYVIHESWCQSWFHHYTFDVGQTDDEAVDSFRRYVVRMMTYNRKNRTWDDKLGDWHEPICLMGADEIWRWRGENGSEKLPCRCKGCKERGVISINH